MTGVDHLIAQGIVDGSKMGALGWSAGGHWSNWILTHTDRFKAISTGAGTSNWISMYAQSDVQRNRQFYLGDKLPYDDFDAYWNQSPLKYIKNAKTPTMIHVVEGDPRVPSPQSVELHMALKQLGVPTELYMYPGNTHGIPDPRNQLVKSVSEMAWMDYYVRGMGKKFAWRDVLKTLEDDAAKPKPDDHDTAVECASSPSRFWSHGRYRPRCRWLNTSLEADMADSALGRIVWYELLTTDMNAAEKFYSNVVGWTVSAFDQTPQPYHMFMRGTEIPAAGVMTIPEGMNFPPHWGMYVAVDKLEDAVAKIKELGGGELSPIIDVPTIGRMQTVLDPQKAAFSVYESSSAHQPDAPRDVGDASWHELMTTDAPGALKFYSQLFGWQQSQAMDMGPMGTYHIFKGGWYDLGGMMNKSTEMAQVPPHWGIYFRVPDVDDAAARVKSNGGQVVNGPMEVPGGDRIVNCVDPQGAYLSLHAKKA